VDAAHGARPEHERHEVRLDLERADHHLRAPADADVLRDDARGRHEVQAQVLDGHRLRELLGQRQRELRNEARDRHQERHGDCDEHRRREAPKRPAQHFPHRSGDLSGKTPPAIR
jgi:hypothetical protein